MQIRFHAIERGTPAYWRASIALFLAALSVFASLYSVQPILPVFAAQFGLDAAASSLALSAATATLAVCLVLMSWLGNKMDRKRLMMASMLALAAIGLVIPLSPNWGTLIALRALLGIVACGIPAFAMVYLAEEMSAEALGSAMGLFIGGSAIGGMSGRLLVGYLADILDWRTALALLGGMVLVNAIAFAILLPASRNGGSDTLSARQFAGKIAGLFKDKALPLLFLSSFLLMGGFVAIYNYIGFRLLGPPYDLSQSQVALIFSLYLLGTLGSALMGALSGRVGGHQIFWPMVVLMIAGTAITLISSIWAVVLGIALLTFGFFAAHAIASAWVAQRAGNGRAQGSAIYLLCYYAGSSVIGTLAGHGWTQLGWPGVTMVAGSAMALTLVIGWRLYRLPPPTS